MGLLPDEAAPAPAHGIRADVPPRKLNADARRLLDAPVLPTLARLAAPTVALMMLGAAVATGETIYVGWLGRAALAGVSLSVPLVILMSALSAGAFGGSVSSGVARALGAGRPEQAAGVAGTALTLAALMGVVCSVVTLAVGRSFYAFIGASGEALELAVRYSDILFLGAVPLWLFNATAAVLRGGGNTAYPALVGAVGSAVTLAVSPLLIFGLGPVPGFGVAGAACTVVAGNTILCGVLLRTVWSARCPARPSLRLLWPRWPYAYEVLRVALPGVAGTLIGNLTIVILTGLVAPFGEAATAGYGASSRLEYLLLPIIFGIGTALIPLVAANDGAGNAARVRQSVRAGAALSAGVCGVVGVAAALYPHGWMRLFSGDPDVLRVGEAYLIRIGPTYALLGVGLSLYFAAQGRGRTVQPLLASLTRLLVAGAGGLAAVRLYGWDLIDLFSLMAAGLAAYGLVMIGVMRRELGLSGS